MTLRLIFGLRSLWVEMKWLLGQDSGLKSLLVEMIWLSCQNSGLQEPLECFKEAKIKEERDKRKKEKKALKKEKQKVSKVDSIVYVLKNAHGEEYENDNRVVVSNISTSHRYDALSKSCDGDSAMLENVISKLGQSDDDPPDE